MVLRLIVTASVVLIMFVCLFTKAELFPFAPYTMYADRYSPQTQFILSVDFQQPSDQWIEVQNQMIRPLDEARLKHAMMTQFFANHQSLDVDPIRVRGREALHLAQKNTGVAIKAIRLQVLNYESLEQLRAGRSHILQELVLRD
jgi:hypothetical protein